MYNGWDAIALHPDKKRLVNHPGIDQEAICLALLPGSRHSGSGNAQCGLYKKQRSD